MTDSLNNKNLKAMCKEYAKLDSLDEKEFIAKLLHAIKQDQNCYDSARGIIRYAEEAGIFDKVKFHNQNINKKT